jgi:hypothetical protein
MTSLSPPLDDLLAVVDTWFAEEVQRAPLSYHTECYNQMYAARANLRDRLAVAITGEPLAPPPGEPGAGEPNADQTDEPEKLGDDAQTGAGGKASTKPSKAGS